MLGGDSQSRWAIYYLPEPASALHLVGTDWLGYDMDQSLTLCPELPPAIPRERWIEVTSAARRYGFHATLKPPFRLADDRTPQRLIQSLHAFASGRRALQCPSLVLARLGGFLALVPSEPCPALEELSADCVRDLDSFRRPLTTPELSSRRNASLTDRELNNLERWGYPYVLDTWKFHMTLTCSLPAEQRCIFYTHLTERCAPACEAPLSISSICLLQEPCAGSRFQLVKRFPLAA